MRTTLGLGPSLPGALPWQPPNRAVPAITPVKICCLIYFCEYYLLKYRNTFFTAKYLDFHYFVTRYRFIGYLINNSLRSNSLSAHAYCIVRVPHEIVICLIFSCKITCKSLIKRFQRG